MVQVVDQRKSLLAMKERKKREEIERVRALWLVVGVLLSFSLIFNAYSIVSPGTTPARPF